MDKPDIKLANHIPESGYHYMGREMEVMFPSTCLALLLSRCEDTDCTRRYLVKRHVQVLVRAEKR